MFGYFAMNFSLFESDNKKSVVNFVVTTKIGIFVNEINTLQHCKGGRRVGIYLPLLKK